MKKLLTILTLMIIFAGGALAADVNVYYFWSNPRCVNCKKIEAYTQSAVASMNDKTVHYKAVDMSKKENKSFVKKYKLYTKSVVLSKNVNGKEEWKNLDGIWTKLGNEKDFKDYLVSEIKAFKGVK